MGKIEEAIRKASLSRNVDKKQGTDDQDAGGQVGDAAAAQSRLVPVQFRLQPGCKHDLDTKTLKRNRIIHDGYPEEALTHYKMLRTRILQRLNANSWTTLAITAAHDGAGKTVTAINLAITLASHGGHGVYLIDFDMRNPAIAEYLGLPADNPGFAAYFDGSAQLTDVLWDVGIENLVVMANRDRIADSSERLTSIRMQELFASFRSMMPRPIAIVDLPPVLTADDAVAVSPNVDGTLMVVSEGETSRADLGQAVGMLRDSNFIGVILNKAGRR